MRINSSTIASLTGISQVDIEQYLGVAVGPANPIDVKVSNFPTDRARLQPWYQPNFAHVGKDARVSPTGPHNYTVRWTYTVPANRLAMIMQMQAFVQRATAATVVGTVQGYIEDSTNAHDLVFAQILTNLPGDALTLYYGQAGIFKAGETVRMTTYDNSTGGTVGYVSNAQFMEFNT